jgi:cytoskeletal protein CcmA (bactofilin family)
MAIWKDQPSVKKDPVPAPTATATVEVPRPEVRTDPFAPSAASPNGGHAAPASVDVPRSRIHDRELKESLIAAELTIEGKIEGAGHVRIAGRFKGDVQVQGNLTIEHGAKVTGSVRAQTVVIAGELEGNVEGAAKVELVESGVLTGDVKAAVFTVAAGSRMRGQVEFGWEKAAKGENGSAA